MTEYPQFDDNTKAAPADVVTEVDVQTESQSEPTQSSENGGFRVNTVEPEGDTKGETAPGHDAVNPETGASPDYEIKSRVEEEEAQHARREAANAEVEAKVAEAKRTPY